MSEPTMDALTAASAAMPPVAPAPVPSTAGGGYGWRRDLELLCGPATAGRLSGSAGAHAAAGLIARRWRALGLVAGAPTGYLQPVVVPAARLTAPPRLQLGPRALRHRRDFAEHAAFSAGGRVHGPLRVLAAGAGLAPAELADAVVLLAEPPADLDLAATADAAAALGARALLVAAGEPHWFYKTVYAGRGALPVLRLRRSEAQALALAVRDAGAGAADAAHWTAALELPLLTQPMRCHNVLARLPGRGHGATLLVCAHFDHVGDDPGGARFPGAFDNASGVALLLALARTLAHERRAPAAPVLPFDVVFAALTGEESGLWGAQQLLQQPPGPIGAVINLDSFGLPGAALAVRTGHARRGDRLAEWAAERLQRRDLHVQWVDGRDDSAVFRQAGWPTLGLGQQPLAPGANPMHTPDDTPDRLDPVVLQRMHDAVLDLIHEFAVFAAMQPQGEAS